MKNKILLLVIFSILSQLTLKAQQTETFRQSVQMTVDQVNIDTIWKNLAYIQTKERYTKSTNAQNTAQYFLNYMKNMGFDTVYLQNYTIANTTYVAPNIIAVNYGKTDPDSTFLACGHWDVYASMAPGADDNGSGTVSVLEAARVLARGSFKKTLKFCLFSGEEQGLYGSKAFIQKIPTTEKVGAALNLDMIGYQASGQPLRSGVFPKTGQTKLYNKALNMQQLYVPGIEIKKDYPCNYACSDIYPFWDAGIDGLFFMETYYFGYYETPYYHSANDLINKSANSKDKFQKTTQIVVALLSTLAEGIDINNEIEEPVKSIVYLKNYPNPTSNYTEIAYQLNSNETVSLFITDIYGREIATLIQNEQQSAGNYVIPYNVSELSNGMYFYHLTTKQSTSIKKMMVIKKEF